MVLRCVSTNGKLYRFRIDIALNYFNLSCGLIDPSQRMQKDVVSTCRMYTAAREIESTVVRTVYLLT